MQSILANFLCGTIYMKCLINMDTYYSQIFIKNEGIIKHVRDVFVCVWGGGRGGGCPLLWIHPCKNGGICLDSKISSCKWQSNPCDELLKKLF